MHNERIFITGGAGFLGKHLIARYYDNNYITIYSRDEAKHYYLKRRYPKINCVIGDIRNYERLLKASKNHTIGIYTASLKQIEAVDSNVEEALDIIIKGAINSRCVSIEHNMKAACFISSDKSRAATTLYGSMKFVAGESFIVNAESYPTALTTAIYGNVMNSTGSIIPLIWDSIINKYELTLYSEDMTRFMLDIEEAVDVIEAGLKYTGVNVIPKLKSFRIKDLFILYADRFNFRYKLGKPRISEKLHEIMLSKEESSRIFETRDKKYMTMHYKNVNPKPVLTTEYSSQDHCLTIEELDNYLKKFNYYKK
jgi:UDP-N-acetylglucosamine 4,6-dehydratase